MGKRYHRALTIAGFDGSGGAGIQADLKAFSALGCYGMTVLTALPVQNTQGVKSIYEIPPQCVKEQLEAILEDIGADAVKIGMIHSREIIEAIVPVLEKYMPLDIVVDPVMVAKSGDRLLKQDAIDMLKEKLFPLATIVTPNLPEASDLLGREIIIKSQMEKAAMDIAKMGCNAVVVKGGHIEEKNCDDCLYLNGPPSEIFWFSHPKVATKNTHGTGCTFSSAITAFLARKFSLVEAVRHAKKYLSGAVEAGAQMKIGKGHGPVHHFYDIWK